MTALQILCAFAIFLFILFVGLILGALCCIFSIKETVPEAYEMIDNYYSKKRHRFAE